MIENVKQFNEEITFQACLAFRASTVTPTREMISDIVNAYIIATKSTSPHTANFNIDVDNIVEKVLTKIVAGTSEHNILEGASTQHQEWLENRRLSIENGLHWNAFKVYMSGSISKTQLEELDRSTDKILGSIEDPERPGKWQSRGLVIGDVQSGKTTNFIGLINKAIDAGYKIIIILSGLHNSLRTQTQKRFEEGVTGFNTQLNDPPPSLQCGVALTTHDNPSELKMMNLTARDDTGDFKATSTPGTLLNVKVYSVNKKNNNTLSNLIDFLKKQRDGNNLNHSTPLLIVDDEADHASINTNKELQKASTINRLIRELVGLFDRHSYVAYTATPFANVLMNTEEEDDLFPRNFIMCLGRPYNYIGPEEVFGIEEDDGSQTDDEEEEDGSYDPVSINERKTKLDWFRNLDEPRFRQDWKFVPTKHQKDLRIDALPESLKYAIQTFLLAVTIRNLRGDTLEHKTMLIHVTRFKDIQNRVHELTEEYVEAIYADLNVKQFEHDPETHIRSFQEVFNKEFPDCEQTWAKVKQELGQSASLVKGHVYAINGDFKDLIDEDKYPNGLTSIRIGGEKLSRGLTLPGLMTNYFIRTSKPYDTLMQMGRWFGYRDGYEDLCRLFTTAKLYNWFGHVALASESLRHRITYMQRARLTPMEFRQEVISHPGVMLVTAKNKQRYTKTLQISWNGQLPAITAFDITSNGISSAKSNLELLSGLADKLIEECEVKAHSQHFIYKDVSHEKIKKLIDKFSYVEGGGNWERRTLIEYINKMNLSGELNNWTVVFFSRKSERGAHPLTLGKHKVFPLKRGVDQTCSSDGSLREVRLKNSALVSLRDEGLDFDDINQIEKSGENKKTGAPMLLREDIREARPNSNGLLLIYLVDLFHATKLAEHKNIFLPTLAISFPISENAKSTQITTGILENLVDEEFEEDDDEE